MEAKFLPDTISYNVIAEIKGTEHPEDIIAFGGHSDSWDVGTGAQDDGGGIIAAWHALKIIKDLGIKPKKTLRFVAWVNEENGVRGGNAYADKHKNEKHSLVFEFDSGVFPTQTIGFSGPDSLLKIVKYFTPMLKNKGDVIVNNHGGGVDIGPMARLGIPAMSLNTKDDGKYFWYHHSEADTPDKVMSKDLNNCAAAIAISVYLYSELK
jgi:carboxypeptidase Q